MRCGFCFFDDEIVIPESQHWLLKVIRPFVQFAICRRCFSRQRARGVLLGGSAIPGVSARAPESTNNEEHQPHSGPPHRPDWLRQRSMSTQQAGSRLPSRTIKRGETST